MAVPGRPNGLMEEAEHDGENSLFEENGLEMDLEADTPLHLRDLASAVQLGDLNALRLALGRSRLRWKNLCSLVITQHLLLERGANLEAKDEDGAVPLHDVCPGGFTEIVQLLLDRATNTGCLKRMLDSVDAEVYGPFSQPLHHAARGEHADVIRLLLANGASPTKTNTYGKIPRELADPEMEAWRVFEAASRPETSQ
ncbi:hypothetical protein REPUB_Repub06bG0172900 [Reevesia pubescens]